MATIQFKIGVLEQTKGVGELFEAQLHTIGQNDVVVFDSAKQLMIYLETHSIDQLFISSPVKDFHWLTLLRNLSAHPTGEGIESILILDEAEKLQHEWLDLIQDYGVGEVLRKPLEIERLGQYFKALSQKNNSSLEENTKKLNALKGAFREGLEEVAKETRSMLTSSKLLNSRSRIFKNQTTDKIATDIQQLIEYDPENYNYQFELLSFYLETGRTKNFNDLLNSLINDIDGADRNYWLVELSKLCMEKGQLEIAEFISDVVQLDCTKDGLVKALIMKGNIFLEKGDIKSAEKAWLDVTSLHKDADVDIYMLGALLFRRKEDYERSIDYLRMSEKLSPFDHRIPYLIALCFEKLGEIENALFMATASVKLYPKYKQANNLISALSIPE